MVVVCDTRIRSWCYKDFCWFGDYDADMIQTQKYDMIVQSMIEMGVDIVYPVELPNQVSLTIDGKNCFEPVVCTLPIFLYHH